MLSSSNRIGNGIDMLNISDSVNFEGQSSTGSLRVDPGFMIFG